MSEIHVHNIGYERRQYGVWEKCSTCGFEQEHSEHTWEMRFEGVQCIDCGAEISDAQLDRFANILSHLQYIRDKGNVPEEFIKLLTGQ